MSKSYIEEYYNAIEKGDVIVGWKIRKAIDVLMARFDDPSFIYDNSKTLKRLDFEEHYCLQGYAPYYNEPLKLMLWQKAIWDACYSFFDKDTKLRSCSELFIEVARKNGKSTMIAGDGNADLFIGPGGVNLCCVSNDDRQAKFIWKEIAGMRSRLDIKDEVTAHNLVEIRNEAKNITIQRLSSKTQNKDGFNFVKCYHDEAHDCKTDDIAEAALRAMSTHDERLYITVSTNGFLNNMYYDKKLKYANKWLNEEIDDRHYLPFLYEQDDEAEVWAGDPKLWEKANPSIRYGVKKIAYIQENIEKAQVDKESRIHLLTKDFNIKVSNASSWLLSEDYDYPQETKTLEEFRGCAALGAVDLSDCGDLTVAKILCMRKGDPVKYIFSKYFIPESKLTDKDNGAKYSEWAKTINPADGEPYITVCKGNKIDQTLVADWLYSLYKKYNIYVMCTGYDRWHSDVFLLRMSKKEGYNMDTIPINQHPKEMSFPMKMVERDLQARLINYGNNPVDKMCFSNTAAKIINDRIMAEKIDGQYNRKIDGTVTLIIAYATLEKNESIFNNYLK